MNLSNANTSLPHLHEVYDLEPGDVVEVTLDAPANVQLMDDENYANYLAGRVFRYRGGHVKQPTFRVQPLDAGRWHLVIDLGGGAGRIRAAARTVTAKQCEKSEP